MAIDVMGGKFLITDHLSDAQSRAQTALSNNIYQAANTR